MAVVPLVQELIKEPADHGALEQRQRFMSGGGGKRRTVAIPNQCKT